MKEYLSPTNKFPSSNHMATVIFYNEMLFLVLQSHIDTIFKGIISLKTHKKRMVVGYEFQLKSRNFSITPHNFPIPQSTCGSLSNKRTQSKIVTIFFIEFLQDFSHFSLIIIRFASLLSELVESEPRIWLFQLIWV